VAATASSPDRNDEHEWLPGSHGPFAGKYTVERILGQGGMGVVFEARHIRLGQRVAIKVLGSALREYPELVERFEREARAAGSLTSTHAVRVFDIDATEDGTPFIVMELLAGRDLSSIVECDGPQPVSRAVRWLIEACDAIAEAHRLGIIHRDLKPSNLFLTDVDGRQLVKVLDFGIAKRVSTQETAITQAVAPLGTPQYMSPEQVRCAKDVDIRTDVWSLGVTLYEMVCGQTPFAHESASACIASIAADPVPDPRGLRPDLPDAFVEVLMKALEKNANRRYQSVEELVAALAPFALDDSFDDEELVSAVRRAYIASANPRTPSELATLDAMTAGFELDSPSPAPAAVEVRKPLESRSDRTVPPAISLASAPPARRFKSAIAMASAAVLGLAALVLTPKCVSTENDASASASHAAVANANVTNANRVAAAAPPAPSPEAPRAAAAPRETAPAMALAVAAKAAPLAAPAQDAAPAQPQLAVAQPVARVAVAVSASELKHPRKQQPEKVPPPAPRAGVHGGLSNPGF
jgi:serine/threonine-protein kinase